MGSLYELHRSRGSQQEEPQRQDLYRRQGPIRRAVLRLSSRILLPILQLVLDLEVVLDFGRDEIRQLRLHHLHEGRGLPGPRLELCRDVLARRMSTELGRLDDRRW